MLLYVALPKPAPLAPASLTPLYRTISTPGTLRSASVTSRLRTSLLPAPFCDPTRSSLHQILTISPRMFHTAYLCSRLCSSHIELPLARTAHAQTRPVAATMCGTSRALLCCNTAVPPRACLLFLVHVLSSATASVSVFRRILRCSVCPALPRFDSNSLRETFLPRLLSCMRPRRPVPLSAPASLRALKRDLAPSPTAPFHCDAL